MKKGSSSNSVRAEAGGRRWDALLAVLFCASVVVAFFVNLHAVPLFDLDEGAFSEATREMFARGDFLSTYLNGAPRYDKPIFAYWAQAGSVWLLGFTELAFRLPSALATTLWVLGLVLFTGRTAGKRTALTAGTLMATSLQVSIIGKAATADALLNLFVAAAALCAYLHLAERSRPALYGAFASAGLGFLTKGPVAVLIPLATALLFSASRRDLRRGLRMVLDPGGMFVFALLALPWYAVQYAREGGGFLEGFLLKHNVGRFLKPMEGHGGSVFYYFPVVLLGLLPHTGLLLGGLGRLRSPSRGGFGAFAVLWFLFVFAFFSLSGTKLPHYVLYGYTGLFVLLAAGADRLRAFWVCLPGLLLFLGLLFLPEVLEAVSRSARDPYVRQMLGDPWEVLPATYRLYPAAGALLALYLLFERRIPGSVKSSLLGLAVAAVGSFLLFPVAGRLQQEPIREAGLLARREGYRVVMWQLRMPSFNVYSQSLVERRHPRPGDVVLTKAKYLQELPGYRSLYERRGIALARVEGG